MRILSWNVNGLRAVMAKGFPDFLKREKFDLLCLQETKLQADQIPAELNPPRGLKSWWSFAEKKGYSGVAVFSRREPVGVVGGLGDRRWDSEGRVLILEFPAIFVVNAYFPNGQRDEGRLRYKLEFYEALFDRMEQLRQTGKAVLVCGDYNTAHNEIDLANPRENSDRSGFLRVERDWLDRIVRTGYTDTFRHLHPDETAYSWWSYRFQSRLKDIGWRIDYLFLDTPHLGALKQGFILSDTGGSDHCPVGAELAL